MQLRSSSASARIDLEGGRLASLIVRGHELLVTEGEKPSRWGSFPMVPWAGRLPFGRLDFGGKVYEFPQTSPPHANHGVGHTSTWTDLDSGTITTMLGGVWPFGGSVTQKFDLSESALVVSIRVENERREMPAMVGWHPWFRRVLDNGAIAALEVSPGRRYELDSNMIPTGQLGEVRPPPWNETFIELDADPQIMWGQELRLKISSSFDHWVIFTEPEHALCVEPQSGPPNQVNVAPFVVGPGHPLEGSMTLRWF